jgi:DNA polymerase (family 10)
MPDPTNAEIAAAFDELADLYELDGAVVHRVLAYRNAARTVREASRSVAGLTREGRVTELAGIGATLEEKIRALTEEGTIPAAAKLRARFPPGLVAITHLPGLGSKKARRLFDELGVDSLDALRAAAEQERIRKLRGFGEKAEQRILAALEQMPEGGPQVRVLLRRALEVGDALVQALQARAAPDARIELAGSARRLVDSVKDLDVVAATDDPEAILGSLDSIDLIEVVASRGDNGAKLRTHSGLAVDLRVVAPNQFGNVLQHLTGSKMHNVALRERSVRDGLHVSEYGVLDDATGETHRCATEEEVYERLGLAWIPPELRENRGELDAARLDGGSGLPALVREEDLRGDLHCHTVASDGRNSIDEMAAAAIERGLSYLAITDHSASHGFGNEVSPERLREQIELIREANARIDGIELLAGSEVNILLDGSPDYDDELLAQLDWVMASVHTSFGIGLEAMTDRLVAAMEHPYIDAIGHPTGRKIESREPYPLDMERVVEAAARTHTMLEINASSDRRDLNDLHARAAAEAGVPILVNTDAHSARSLLGGAPMGIATARRAWLTPAEVANTRAWEEFGPMRKRARSPA